MTDCGTTYCQYFPKAPYILHDMLTAVASRAMIAALLWAKA